MPSTPSSSVLASHSKHIDPSSSPAVNFPRPCGASKLMLLGAMEGLLGLREGRGLPSHGSLVQDGKTFKADTVWGRQELGSSWETSSRTYPRCGPRNPTGLESRSFICLGMQEVLVSSLYHAMHCVNCWGVVASRADRVSVCTQPASAGKQTDK